MTPLPNLAELEDAAARVHETVSPTLQYTWPLLNARAGLEVWVKHENHTPLGAFKVRGGLVYFDWLRRTRPDVRTVITATRGNHGQSVAFAAKRHRLHAVIVVPRGNAAEKNAAMRALGAELIEEGDDFQAALDYAQLCAQKEGAHFVPAFHRQLVAGVASYALEFFRGAPPLDVAFVPVGLGSGICGVIAARDALGLRTRLVGVVSAGAPTYRLSFDARKPVPHPVATALADGVACRQPNEEALTHILRGVERIVEVTDEQVAAAMRALFTDTHNAIEGAGAATLAALVKERASLGDGVKRVGLILTGANVDRDVFARVLAGDR